MIANTFFSALGNHLWQSTVFGGAICMLAMTLRGNRARTRYWLWLAASLKFLIPFSLLISIGSRFGAHTATVARPELSMAIQEIGQPFASAAVSNSSASFGTAYESWLPVALLSLWACGFLAITLSWAVKWWRVRAAVREGCTIAMNKQVPVVSTPSVLEPGIFGVFRPLLLLPKGITERLTPAHLEAIVAHELCHLRYRDNLAAAFHMAVEALFWFHPLVWWLGGRLVEERELACDEEVLSLGNEPEIYAESILKTCEFCLESRLACVSGVTGADLKKRIRRIMMQDMARNLQLGKKVLLAVCGAAAITVPLVFGVLHAAPRNSTAGDATVATPAHSFEVASIEPNASGDQRMHVMLDPSGRFNAEGVPLKLIFEEAYDVKDSQIVGAPSWFGSDRYTIQAKPDDATTEEMRKASPDKRREIMAEMLQSLLAERSKLKLRQETRDLPVYSMVVGKDGPKFHESAPMPADANPENPPPPPGPGPQGGRRMNQGIRMNGRGDLTMMSVPLDMFANVLSRQLGRPVINDTGLKGRYDFSLKWTPTEEEGAMFKGAGPDGRPPGDEPPPPDASGPSIFTAVREQLGLKLEAKKAPLPVFVIDHIEKPSEN
jgi:bla regulator protein blaR1